MVQALARVDEIRSGLVALQDPAGLRAGASATGTGASGGASAGAADFASVLASVTGTTAATGAAGTDLTGSLLSSLPGAQGGTDDLAARLWSALVPGATAGVPTTAASASGVGAAVVETAREYLGVPYVWGGESLAEGGLDCSGLVQLVLGRHGVDVPRVAADQMRVGTEVASLAQAQPGDLVVQRGGKHIGIYVGDGQMIHAPRPGETVEITPVTDASVTTIRRVVG
ncbi:C40 family peptidase [Cellulosimicrobium sp. CUA-896]|uniref:C40 family peptidase n=1 Tax=Cellulosimicrobium sp. CUA-896 TaxID=1517881 RepID=UPI0011150881|nr:C40 family peptidase [Cellulosimicrobium sp. CUA-896]